MPTTRTAVADTIYNASLATETGTITLTPDSRWITLAGEAISPTPIVLTLVNGAFTVSLIPTDQLTVVGHYYNAVYAIGSTRLTAVWVVPSTGSTLTLEDVESAAPAGRVFSYQVWAQITTPTVNPTAGAVKVYAKSDGLAILDSTGTEYGVSTNAVIKYFGPDADGGWRITVSGTDLVFQKKETGTWVTKYTMTPA